MNRVSTYKETSLSPSERRVARLFAWGYTVKEIADRLFRSELTISTQLRTIYRKLDIHKDTDLTRWWIFNEYAIADNPFKKVIAVFFLALSIGSILADNDFVRVFRSAPIRPVVRTMRTRARRYENVFDLHLALTA